MPFKSRKQQQWYNATDQDFLDDKPSSHRQVENISFADEVEKKWFCNLCNMSFEDTPDVEQRKKRHEDFHKDESVGKVGARRRNWTFGKVDWDFKEDRNKTSMYEVELISDYLDENDEIRKLTADDSLLEKFLEKRWKEGEDRLHILESNLSQHLSDYNHGGLYPSDTSNYFVISNKSLLQFIQNWASKTGKALESLVGEAEANEDDWNIVNKRRKASGKLSRQVGIPNHMMNIDPLNLEKKKEIKNEILKEMIEEEKKADEGRRGSGNPGSKVGGGMNMVGYSLDMLWKEFDIYGDSGRYKWNDDDFGATKVGADQSWIKFAVKRGADPMEAKYFFFKKMDEYWGGRKSKYHEAEFKEEDHPRDENNQKFVKKGGGSSSSDDSSRMEKHNKKVRGGSNLAIKEGDSEDEMTLKELRVKKIDLGHDDENSDEWWDLDGQIQQLKKKITADKYSNLDMGKITEEKMKTALDIQDDKISDKQKGRIESHFERNKEAIEKSEFGNELRKLVSEFSNLQEKIAKGRAGCSYDESTDTFDGDWEGIEMLCGASTSTVWTGMIKEFGFKSNLYNGYYDNKEGNHRRHSSWEEIGHAFIQLDDGTIIDPSYGQMYPTEVNINSDLRLRIISPDDPEHENYIPEYRVYPLAGRTQKMTKDNNYGKDMPRSSYMTKKELEDVMTGKQKGGLDAKNIVMGYTSPEDRKKIKTNTMRYSDKGVDEWKNERGEEIPDFTHMKEIDKSEETGTTDGAIKGWITRRAGGKGGLDDSSGSAGGSFTSDKTMQAEPEEIAKLHSELFGDNEKRSDKMLDEIIKKEHDAYLKGKSLTKEERKIAFLNKKYDDVFSYNTYLTNNPEELENIFGNIISEKYFSEVKESDIKKLNPHQKALFNKMKRIHEAIESDDSIRKIDIEGELDIQTTTNYRFNLEKSYMLAQGENKEKGIREYADRIGTEIITPLINSDVHMYYIQKDPDEEGDFFKNSVSDMIDHAYDELKYMNSKNIWTKELGRQMNLKLYAKKGHFKPEDFNLDSLKGGDFRATGFWNHRAGSINIFDRHPRIGFRSPTSATLAHELTHAVHDARSHQADSNPTIKNQMDRLTKIAEGIDPEIVGKYLGNYAKSYVDIFKEEGRKGWAVNLETELLSAITDKLNSRISWMHRQATGKTFSEATMKKHMPELMKVYKELFGKEYKWEEPKPVTRKWKTDSEESVGIEYDVQFLDENRNIVPKEEAIHVIRKGYQNNELIIFEHLEKSENADEVGGQVAKSEIIGSDTVKYGKLDPKKYLNDISWSN